MRHNVSEALVVIAFDPNNFQTAFRIGKLANESQKFPMFFSEPPKIQVCEDVAQQNQPPKTIFLQHASGLASMAGVGAQMDIRKDQRIVDGRIHTLLLPQQCYGLMKSR